MRITGGKARGHKIKVPEGNKTRPAQDIVRQAIFNLIGEHIAGARVLDLFAGSGSLGLEALSRGAAWCDFVDKNKKATAVIQENLLKTKLQDKGKVYTMDAKRFLERTAAGIARPFGVGSREPVEPLDPGTAAEVARGLDMQKPAEPAPLPRTSPTSAKYDFIFLSPPYAQEIDVELLEKMVPVLQSRGLIVFDHSARTQFPQQTKLILIEQRTYGATTVSFLQKRPPKSSKKRSSQML